MARPSATGNASDYVIKRYAGEWVWEYVRAIRSRDTGLPDNLDIVTGKMVIAGADRH